MTKLDILIIGLIVGAILIYNISKFWGRKKRQLIMAKAKKAEGKAAKWLQNMGFEVVETQCRVPIYTYVDGREHQNYVQADLIVRRGRKVYVAEVKTGDEAPKPTNAATRRQLLEYYLAFKPDGILLCDMESGKVKEVSFQGPVKGLFSSNNRYLVVALIVVFLLGICFGVWYKEDINAFISIIS